MLPLKKSQVYSRLCKSVLSKAVANRGQAASWMTTENQHQPSDVETSWTDLLAWSPASAARSYAVVGQVEQAAL